MKLKDLGPKRFLANSMLLMPEIFKALKQTGESYFNTLEIQTSDRIFSNVVSWFDKNKLTSRPLKVRGVATFVKGFHFANYKGVKVILVPQEAHSDEHGSDLILYFLSPRSEILREFILEMNESEISKLMLIYVAEKYGWGTGIETPGRNWDSIYLNPDTETELRKDIDHFLASKEFYEKRDVPYRRGYLFYGPPGTGKTSLAKVISTEYDRPLYLISGGENEFWKDIVDLGKDCPPRTVVLLEDFESLIGSPEESSSKKNSLSSLLNFMDGVLSTENRILIATTNHIDKIPTELLRPGRIDKRFELGYISEVAFLKMCKLYFPQWDEPELKELYGTLNRLTPAQVQEALLSAENLYEFEEYFSSYNT